MPRKTKETDNKKENIKLAKKVAKKAVEKVSAKSVSAKTKKADAKKVEAKKSTTGKATTKKVGTKEAAAKKVETKKSTTEKVTAKKVETKKTATKKVATKKSSSKKVTKTSTTKTTSEPKKQYSPEYYDLPYRYNKTMVKILAQTPTDLFVYWEISDEDRNNFKNEYGQYFFEITKPVLVIHNETMRYSFEIDINDFANSWYIQVNDSDCEYKVELGRRPIPINYSYMPQYDAKKEGPIKPVENPYIYISSSNDLDFPNDHILFNTKNKVYFKNVKTNQIIEKDIKDFPFAFKDNKFINIYEIYEQLFKEEITDGNILRNPGSGSLSSKFK